MLNFSNDELKVIKSIFTQEHPTRISLSQKTKMSLVKISSILNSLEKKDCIMRAGKIKPASGRPSCIFKLHPELGYTLGVSIFLDSFRIVAMDCSENLIYDELFSLQLAEW